MRSSLAIHGGRGKNGCRVKGAKCKVIEARRWMGENGWKVKGAKR